jgi:hypothetical protein
MVGILLEIDQHAVGELVVDPCLQTIVAPEKPINDLRPSTGRTEQIGGLLSHESLTLRTSVGLHGQCPFIFGAVAHIVCTSARTMPGRMLK